MRYSGAEAPAVNPIILVSLNLFQGTSFVLSNKKEFLQPDWTATSTNLLELDELVDPITIKVSQFGAIFLTTFCRFVVA